MEFVKKLFKTYTSTEGVPEMNHIGSRNPQSAMPRLLQLMYRRGDKDGEMLIMPEPVMFTFQKPRERLIFWPGFQRNPVKELVIALTGLRQVENVISKAAQDVVDGKEHFVFVTPQLMVQANIDRAGKFNMRAVVAEQNPFLGAFGHLMLQLTILQELMANAVDKDMGAFSIMHMSLKIRADLIEKFLKESLDDIPGDPYSDGLKTRRIDGTINMSMLLDEGAKATGYRSKWVRAVALPMFLAASGEDFDESMKRAKSIKADDWKRSYIEYLYALKVAKEATDGD